MPEILVVEDEAQQRSEIEKALAKASHLVVGASGGNEAVARLKEKRYDLLVTDLMMEQGTRFEILEWVREIAPGMPVASVS